MLRHLPARSPGCRRQGLQLGRRFGGRGLRQSRGVGCRSPSFPLAGPHRSLPLSHSLGGSVGAEPGCPQRGASPWELASCWEAEPSSPVTAARLNPARAWGQGVSRAQATSEMTAQQEGLQARLPVTGRLLVSPLVSPVPVGIAPVSSVVVLE